MTRRMLAQFLSVISLLSVSCFTLASDELSQYEGFWMGEIDGCPYTFLIERPIFRDHQLRVTSQFDCRSVDEVNVHRQSRGTWHFRLDRKDNGDIAWLFNHQEMGVAKSADSDTFRVAWNENLFLEFKIVNDKLHVITGESKEATLHEGRGHAVLSTVLEPAIPGLGIDDEKFRDHYVFNCAYQMRIGNRMAGMFTIFFRVDSYKKHTLNLLSPDKFPGWRLDVVREERSPNITMTLSNEKEDIQIKSVADLRDSIFGINFDEKFGVGAARCK